MKNICSENMTPGKAIALLFKYGEGFISRKFADYNIGPGQHRILLMLFKKDGISQEELAQNLYLDKSSLSRTIKKLVENGYIMREKRSEDKRCYLIKLTEKGMSIKDAICNVLDEWNDILLSQFDKEEKNQLVHYLHKMFKNCQQHINLKG